MLSVIQLEWLLLIFCGVLILFVGCSNLPSRTPTPTASAYPPVTLTVVPLGTPSPIPRSTLPPSMTHFTTISPRQVSTVGSSPPTIRSTPPNCFSSPNSGSVCYGRIWNDSSETITNVVTRTQLKNASQTIIASQRFALEQQYIPPNSFAPYRAHFSNLDHNTITANTTVMGFDTVSSETQLLVISGSRGAVANDGRYRLTITVTNTTSHISRSWRLVASLISSEDEIVGYRVFESEQIIDAGEQITVHLEMIPQILATDLRHHVHVEGD